MTSKYASETIGEAPRPPAQFPRPEPGDDVAPRIPAFAPGADVIDLLPPVAAAKLEELRDAATAASAVLVPLREELNELRQQRAFTQSRIQELLRGTTAAPLHEDDERIEELRRKVKKLSAKIEKTAAKHDTRAAAWSEVAGLVDRIERYLRSLRGMPIELAPPPAPVKIGRGEDHIAAITRARGQIDKARERLQAAVDAPRSSAFARELAREKVERLAERGCPNCLVSIEAGRPFEFATIAVGGGTIRGQAGASASLIGTRIIDAEATIAWILRDQLLAAIDAEIDRVADDDCALSDGERRERIEAAKAEILALGRIEEEIIVAAQESGVTVSRRPDVDVRAVLSLADDMPEPQGF